MRDGEGWLISLSLHCMPVTPVLQFPPRVGQQDSRLSAITDWTMNDWWGGSDTVLRGFKA